MSEKGNASACSGPCPTHPQLQLYQTIIFATPVLFAFLLLILFCMLYIKRYSENSSQARVQFVSRGLFPTPLSDHGLSKSFRQQLPTIPADMKFTAPDEDDQCAICLSDYQLNEYLQQLPACGHVFHVSCIDAWLAKNKTCPICRTSNFQEGSNSIGISVRTEGNRQWEERVVNEVQDGNVHVRSEASDGESSSSGMVASSLETLPHFSSEHAMNIERS